MAAVAVGAKERYPCPLSLSTSAQRQKFSPSTKRARSLGGIIAPGVKISAEALAAKTAALPLVGVTGDPIKKVIGTNTIDCMRSGLLNGTAFMLDGMIESFEREIGEKCTVIATGAIRP